MDRKRFTDLIVQHGLPKSTVAAIAGVYNTAVSDYFHGRCVDPVKIRRIEQAIEDLSMLTNAFVGGFSIGPNMKDIPKLGAAIAEIKAAITEMDRETALEKQQLALNETVAEVTRGLAEMASVK